MMNRGFVQFKAPRLYTVLLAITLSVTPIMWVEPATAQEVRGTEAPVSDAPTSPAPNDSEQQAPPPAASPTETEAPKGPAIEPEIAQQPAQNSQPATPEGYVHMPGWVLLLIAAAVVVGSVTVATQSYIRFLQTRRELEG